jgi:hypothetical protein
MATLFNTKIKDTYQSLLKLEDNTILTTTTKNITDGLGNASPLYMSTTQVRIGSTSASALYWDNVNNRLGIGTSSPTQSIETPGAIKFASANSDSTVTLKAFDAATGNIDFTNEFIVSRQGTNLMKMFFNNRIAIGGAGSSAKLSIRGEGSTSATTSLLVQNSSGLTSLQVTDDRNTFAAGLLTVGTMYTGVEGTNLYTAIFNNGGSGGQIRLSMGGTNYLIVYQPRNAGSGITSGEINTITTPVDYGWSSGSASPNLLSLNPSINNTGTYSGGTFRGIYYNPTLTSLTGTNHIAIQTVTGDVLFGTTSGLVGIGTIYTGWRLNVDGAIRAQRIDLTGSAGPGHVMVRIDDNGTVLRNNTFNINSGNGNAGQSANLAVGNIDSTLARLYVRGSGSTSATSSLLVQNSSATELLKVTDDGSCVITGTLTATNGKFTVSNIGNQLRISNSAVGNYFYIGPTNTCGVDNIFTTPYLNAANLSIQDTSGSYQGSTMSLGDFNMANVGLSHGLTISSSYTNNGAGGPNYGKQVRFYDNLTPIGTQLDMTFAYVNPTINYTASATGIVVGFEFAPVLTSVTAGLKIRAFQCSTGGVYINTTTPNDAAALQVDSTTQGVLFPRMTTTQKLAIASPVGGLVVYDTTTNKLCCYNGTTWNDLF